MRKLIFVAFTAIMFLCCFQANASGPGSIIVDMTQQDNSQDPDEKNNKGHRLPVRTQTCLIDFDSHTISTSVSADIISYELWDENGESIVLAFGTDSDMVVYLSEISGLYQLRLVTEKYTYIGYIEL